MTEKPMSLTLGDYLPKSAASDIVKAFPPEEGWEVRQWESRRPEVLDIGLPESRGGVTMNLKGRRWAPGGGNDGFDIGRTCHWLGVAHNSPYVEYKGRGWFLRMCMDVRKATARCLIDECRPSYRHSGLYRQMDDVPEWCFEACGDEWLEQWKLLWGTDNAGITICLSNGEDHGARVPIANISEAFWGAMLTAFDLATEALVEQEVDGERKVLLTAVKGSDRKGRECWDMDYVNPCQVKGMSYDHLSRSGERLYRTENREKNGLPKW